jgi:signal transduction histidine kinase
VPAGGARTTGGNRLRRLYAAVSAANRDRLLWAVRVRWLAIAGFSALAVVAWTVGVLPSLRASAAAGVASAALNAANHWCVIRRRYLHRVTALAIPADVLLITFLIVRTGGTDSPFIMLYVVQVVATAMLVDLLVAAAAAVASAGCFLAAVWLSRTPGEVFVADNGAYQFIWGLFLLYCLALLTYLGGYIAARLQRSEDDLAERNEHLRGALGSLEAAHADLQRTVDRLTRTEAQLVQSEKMRALGQFVAGVAHELNNPIGFVTANLEHVRRAVTALETMLGTYASTPLEPAAAAALGAQARALRLDELREDLPSALADCEEGARRAADIVASLRTFVRPDSPDQWSCVDLRQRIDRMVSLARHRLGGAAVRRDYHEVPPVQCLPGQLDQVWLNLLANAADAVGNDGNIAICIAPKSDGGGGSALVAVAIADDGPGMPAEVRARIFEPFFTTKPEGRGVGLGLSVSYAIVERHGGSMTVESIAGRGTTVTVLLPISHVT